MFNEGLDRRRQARPTDEYHPVTGSEWLGFEEHFDQRRVELGGCARPYGTPCQHDHACVRCALLRPDLVQLARIEEIRDNLIARIAEAEREGWLGEVEGLRVSLAGVEDKLVPLDARQERGSSPVFLGVPPFNQIGARGSGQPGTGTETTLSRED
ncbi:hypothetical protein ACWEPC_16210 [Nonomuraea sp. NPDC004297]